MDYRKELLKEYSPQQSRRIAIHASQRSERFNNLMRIFLAGPYRITQRAAWPVHFCVKQDPMLIQPFLPHMIKILKRDNPDQSVTRNILRLFQFVDFPPRYHGVIADLCFHYLRDTKQPVAIHVFAMSVLAGVAEKHTELQAELVLIISDRLPFSSPAFRSRGNKIMMQLKRSRVS